MYKPQIDTPLLRPARRKPAGTAATSTCCPMWRRRSWATRLVFNTLALVAVFTWVAVLVAMLTVDIHLNNCKKHSRSGVLFDHTGCVLAIGMREVASNSVPLNSSSSAAKVADEEGVPENADRVPYGRSPLARANTHAGQAADAPSPRAAAAAHARPPRYIDLVLAPCVLALINM